MAQKDEEVYGLSKDDCQEVINLLGSSLRPVPGMPGPEQPRIYFGKSASLITAGSTGTVTIWTLGATPAATSNTLTARNIATDQDSTSNLLGICREDAGGEWVIFFEVCS